MFFAPQPLPARSLHWGHPILLRFGGIGRLTFFAWLLLASLGTARAQAPGWSQLALPLSSPAGATFISASALDASGNIYIMGLTRGPSTFGGTSYNLAQTDTYVAKWNPTGGFVWAVRCGGGAGSSNFDNAYIRPISLAVQGNNVYIGGIYTGATAAFGSTILPTGGPAFYTSNSFVAKITDAGASASFTWATRLSSTSGAANSFDLRALSAGSGGVYAAGYFTGATFSVGSTTLTNTPNNVPASADVYLAKITDAGTSGSVTWVRQGGGIYSEQADALAVRGNQVFLTGTTGSPTASFGSASAPSIGGINSNTFVARLTDSGPTGSFDWVTRAGGAAVSSDLKPAAIALNGTSVYVSGIYQGDATFGASTLPTVANTNYNVFVAKLTDAGSSGAFNWGLAGGSDKIEYVRGLAVNGSSVYVSGRFIGLAATFGSTVLPNPSQPSIQASAVYLAKCTDAGASGAWAWAQQGGGVNGNATICSDEATGVLLGTGRGYLLGTLSGLLNTTTPNTTVATFGTQVQTVPGSIHPFIATWTDNTLLAAAPATAARPAFSLWPNPAHGTATVRLPAGAEAGPLLLLDGLGRTVRHFATPVRGATDALLDLRGLPAGPYVLRGAGRAQH